MFIPYPSNPTHNRDCLCILLLLSYLFFAASTAQAHHYTVEFTGRSYDLTRNETTFSYAVSGSGQPPALSHFQIEVPRCEQALVITGCSPTGQTNNCTPQEDPSTTVEVFGIKWDFSLEEDGYQQYSITYAGNVSSGIVQTVVKAGQLEEVTTLPGASCDSNRVPTCVISGSYLNLACSESTQTLELDGSASYDADDDALTFAWSTNCPGAVFTSPTAVLGSLTLDSELPDGIPTSCSVTLSVSDGLDTTQCSTSVTVNACEYDCLGVLNGSAIYDGCGVCDGDNQDLDECGVCFGSGPGACGCDLSVIKDRCGMCGGDGSSCIEGEEYCPPETLVENTIDFPTQWKAQLKALRKLLKELRRLNSGSHKTQNTTQFIKRVRKMIKKTRANIRAYSDNLPPFLISGCGNCIELDNTSLKADYRNKR